MSSIATLVSSMADPQVGPGLVAAAERALGADGHRVLAGEVAAEFPLPAGLDPGEADRRLRDVVADRAVDVAVLSAANRRKRLLVADMDSTMIGQECIDELAAFAGLKAKVSAITEQAMRGEIAFEPALRARVALLRGLPISVVDEVLRERITLTPGGPELVRTMRAHGAYAALVSGGFTVFTGEIRTAIGFDEDRANTLLTDAGLLTGEVVEPILGQDAKLASLRELRDRFGLAAAETMAVGDGANDLAMVREAGLGVAFRAKPAVAAEAAVRIDHADLSALLFIQGYAREEFVHG
ncbi:MAG TPA: phosphoserine phosphatase SerB [Methylomirabilota bacterium]|nr:phosphoserine phosphatase SerB [Methylomirabilota bacterium]